MFDQVAGHNQFSYVGLGVGKAKGPDAVEGDAAAVENVEPGCAVRGGFAVYAKRHVTRGGVSATPEPKQRN